MISYTNYYYYYYYLDTLTGGTPYGLYARVRGTRVKVAKVAGFSEVTQP